MTLIHSPKKWAYLVAAGPAFIVVSLLAIVMRITGVPGGIELMLLSVLLGLVALPAVLAGMLLDIGVIERETGVKQKKWVWALFGLLLAPLTGTLYLWSRRKYFIESTA